MGPETWELLNGMGFGEMQSAECRMQNCGGDAPASHPCDPDMGLDVPGFMYETTQSVLVPAVAYRAQGVGRVKRAQHRREKQVRDVVNGVFWGLVVFAGVVLACNLAMWLADGLGRMVLR